MEKYASYPTNASCSWCENFYHGPDHFCELLEYGKNVISIAIIDFENLTTNLSRQRNRRKWTTIKLYFLIWTFEVVTLNSRKGRINPPKYNAKMPFYSAKSVWCRQFWYLFLCASYKSQPKNYFAVVPSNSENVHAGAVKVASLRPSLGATCEYRLFLEAKTSIFFSNPLPFEKRTRYKWCMVPTFFQHLLCVST